MVWLLSATISIPPVIATMFGLNDLKNFNDLQQCELSNNKAYVIYSACGSFYIPALIIMIVYAHVFIETRKRFRERAKGESVRCRPAHSIDAFVSGRETRQCHSRDQRRHDAGNHENDAQAPESQETYVRGNSLPASVACALSFQNPPEVRWRTSAPTMPTNERTPSIPNTISRTHHRRKLISTNARATSQT